MNRLHIIRSMMALILEERSIASQNDWDLVCERDGKAWSRSSTSESEADYSRRLRAGERIPHDRVADGVYAKVVQNLRWLDEDFKAQIFEDQTE